MSLLAVPPNIEGDSEMIVELAEGDEMNLDCSFVGSPTPIATWSHEEAKISSRAKLLAEGRHLHVDAIVPVDAGRYVSGNVLLVS